MIAPILNTARSKQGPVQEKRQRDGDGTRQLAAAAAAAVALTATLLWSSAMAAEAEIRAFTFGCETPDGQIVKPRHGDIEGVSYTDLPAQRQQCLGTIDRKIALCWENTEFESTARNEAFAACLPIFRKQARDCVGHFSFERAKCGTDTPGPGDDAALEQDEQPTRGATPEAGYRVEPADRLMEASEAANVRTGPGPDYDIIGTVNSRDRVRVTGEVRGRDWVRVEFRDSGSPAFIYVPLLRRVRAATGAASSVEPAGPEWSITENQPCQVWNYGQRDYEPFTWSGACEDGKASGDGRLIFRGGEGRYEGGMHAGMMHGSGVLSWANGFRYAGELRHGKQHGYGTFTEASGERYEGEWRDGRPHGQGTYVQGDGTVFDGEWRDGCFGEPDGHWASIGTTAAACGFE